MVVKVDGAFHATTEQVDLTDSDEEDEEEEPLRAPPEPLRAPPKKCLNCHTQKTLQWRRGPAQASIGPPACRQRR
jgi:hypothetical protein